MKAKFFIFLFLPQVCKLEKNQITIYLWNLIPMVYTLYTKDVGSPDARLKLECLRLNDGVKLWVSFKLT